VVRTRLGRGRRVGRAGAPRDRVLLQHRNRVRRGRHEITTRIDRRRTHRRTRLGRLGGDDQLLRRARINMLGFALPGLLVTAAPRTTAIG
jgi:hypothetical protein